MDKKIKVNLHILEACNFRCRHCFAKFGEKRMLPVEEWKKIVDNCMASGAVSEFNIAGGEPMLYSGMEELAKYIKEKEAKVSLITNGSRMDEEWVKRYAWMFSTIGFSVDSINADTNKKIGRCDKNGNGVSGEKIVMLCELIKKHAPGCRIKVNTVVSALNKDEDLSGFIASAGINRWKILRMKLFKYGDFSNSDIEISDEKFNKFVKQNVGECPEENPGNKNCCRKYTGEAGTIEVVLEDSLKASYIFIDSNGCLLDNALDTVTHIAICDCKKEAFTDGLKRLTFDEDLYMSRYTNNAPNF